MFHALLLVMLFGCLLGVIHHDSKPVTQIKPLSWIKPDSRQARKDFGTEEELRRFGEDLRRKQLQPLVCLADGRLLCGERRYRAALLVGLTHLEVKVLEEELSDTQIRVYQLCENLLRKDLTAFERWMGCVDLLSINASWALKDLAHALNADPSTVTRWVCPSRCSVAWQEALKEGLVGISDCYQASQLSEADQAELLRLKQSGATRDEVARVGRQKRNGHNGQAPAVRLERVKISMPEGAMVTITGRALGLTEVVDLLAETLKAARAAADKYDVKTWMSMMKDRAKAIS